MSIDPTHAKQYLCQLPLHSMVHGDHQPLTLTHDTAVMNGKTLILGRGHASAVMACCSEFIWKALPL